MIPALAVDLDGVLNIAGTTIPNGDWSHLIAPDGSGNWVAINPSGVASVVPAGHDDPYSQFVVSSDGHLASVMPLRSGGPLPSARWWNYAIVVVPTSGL